MLNPNLASPNVIVISVVTYTFKNHEISNLGVFFGVFLVAELIFHHQKVQKKPDSASEREIEANEEDIEVPNNFDWYFNRNRIIEPSNVDRTLEAEQEIEQE